MEYLASVQVNYLDTLTLTLNHVSIVSLLTWLWLTSDCSYCLMYVCSRFVFDFFTIRLTCGHGVFWHCASCLSSSQSSTCALCSTRWRRLAVTRCASPRRPTTASASTSAVTVRRRSGPRWWCHPWERHTEVWHHHHPNLVLVLHYIGLGRVGYVWHG